MKTTLAQHTIPAVALQTVYSTTIARGFSLHREDNGIHCM